MSEVPMYEYLLWSNCNNNCKFCWQKKKHDITTILDEAGKLESITQCMDAIRELPYSDILVVGGEVYAPQGDAVNAKLRELFDLIAQRVRDGQTRYFYANSNLIYDDLTNVEAMYEAFQGVEDKIKFTTSVDEYGRFDHGSEELCANALANISVRFPLMNVVVNIIMTKQFYEWYLNEEPDTKERGIRVMTLKRDFPCVKYVNLLPYIPVEDDRSMDITFGEVVRCLEEAEREEPGYILHYVQDYDYNQNKILYEYHTGEGFRLCTANYLDCGHNANFTKVCDGKDCFICRLKEYLNERIA